MWPWSAMVGCLSAMSDRMVALPTGSMTGSPEPSYWTASPAPRRGARSIRVVRWHMHVPDRRAADGQLVDDLADSIAQHGVRELARRVPGRGGRFAARGHPDPRRQLRRLALDV